MGIMYENPSPPSDYEYEDIEIPIFFTYPRPQRVFAPPFITIDYSLIHPKFLGIQYEKGSDKINEDETKESVNNENETKESVNNENETKESVNNENETKESVNNKASPAATSNSIVENVDRNSNKVDQLNTTKNEEINLIPSTDENTSKNKKHKTKKRALKEMKNSSKVKDKTDIFHKLDYMCATHEKKKQLHPKSNQSKREQSFDIENNKSVTSAEVSEIQIISKPYSKESKISDIDLDCSKPKLRKYLGSKHSKRIAVSDDCESSNSERSKASDYYSRRYKDHRSISSDDELPLPYRSKTSSRRLHNKRRKSPEVVIKQEIFSDEEENSYLKKHERFSRKRFYESDDSTDNISFYESRHRRYDADDDGSFEWRSPKKEVKQEIKHEPMDGENSKEFYGPDVFYCSFCKLTLNSELTWNSHLLGKRHAKAIRAQSVHEVAKSSLLASTYVPIREEGKKHDKPPSGVKRIELKNAVTLIQELLNEQEQIVGLKHVWEIRGEAETTYYCNLCDAPCFASSIMSHLKGSSHKLKCLEEYFPRVHSRYKDAYKKMIKRIMKDTFSRHEEVFRSEKIRVFKDIPITDHKKGSARSFDQPGPSGQSASNSQGNAETMTIMDENGKPVVPSNQEFLDTKFADFHCTACDSHMNNIAMWEAHIRGKRHLKNLKKAPEGVAATNKCIEAPPGTVSNLERQIEDSDDIYVGLNYIREIQSTLGNQYNCFPCGGCCSDIDIVDHILNMKHKIKILEKMQVDGFENGIIEINNIQVSNYFREEMVNEECRKMIRKYGQGKPQIYIKKNLMEILLTTELSKSMILT